MDQPEHPVHKFIRISEFPEELDPEEMCYLFYCIAFLYGMDKPTFLGVARNAAKALKNPTAN